MARFADIRVFIPSIMPLATYGEIAIFLNKVVNPKFEQFTTKHFKGWIETVTRVDKETYAIGRYNFLISDAKKALKEYQLLSTGVDPKASLLITVYTRPMTRDMIELEFLGDTLGRVHSQLLKRAANWARLGAHSSFVVEHKSPSGKKLHININNIHKFSDSVSATIYYSVDGELVEVTTVYTPILVKGAFTTFKERISIINEPLIVPPNHVEFTSQHIADGVREVVKNMQENRNQRLARSIKTTKEIMEAFPERITEVVPELLPSAEPKKSFVKTLLGKVLPRTFFGAKA